MEYKVKYIDSEGKRHEKVYAFNSENELIEKLKAKKYEILDITSINKKTKNMFIFSSNTLKENIVTELLKQFSILLRSGIDIKTAMKFLHEQESNKELKTCLRDIGHYLDSGYTLGESFELCGKFPNLISGVIEAGEFSSELPASMEMLSNYYDNESKIKQNMRNAMYYPIILLFVTGIIVLAIITFVLPNYVTLFHSYENLELPWMTRLLINGSNFLSKYFLLIPICIILLVIIFKILKNNKKIYFNFSKQILKVPVLGKYIVNLEVLRFSGVFSLLVKSGIETIEAIKIASKSLSNEYLKERILNSKNVIIKGSTIFDSLTQIDELPKMFLNLINVGETSSKLGETMDISYNYYKDLVSNQSKKLTSLFEPLIIIFVSLVVGTIVIAIALPTFEIVNIL
ncbi:MAG: type II secretion system F family protein [Tissierellia bacterium]|nr:type II secretion system F family protein [Tissierellia bacterium]